MRRYSIGIGAGFAMIAGLGMAFGVHQVHAQGQAPCAQIRSACEQAGFQRGAAKEGRGLQADCISPIMQGTPQRPKASRPLPQIDPQMVSDCKARRPNFGQPKEAPSQPPNQAEPSEKPAAPPEPHADNAQPPVAVAAAETFATTPVAVAKDGLVGRLADLTKRTGYKDVDFGSICAQLSLPGDCKVYEASYDGSDGTSHSVAVNVEPDTKIAHVFIVDHDKVSARSYLVDLDGKLLKAVSGKNEGRGWVHTKAPINRSVRDGFEKEVHYWRKQVDHLSCEDEQDRDREITGCTAIITKGRETKQNIAVAYNNRAAAYNAKGDYDRALADADLAVNFNPQYPIAYVNRAFAYRNKGDNDRALTDDTKAIEIDPNYANSYNDRAWTYFKAGNAAQGLPDADKSLQLRPDYANALDTRGHIFEALGRKEEAIADYRRALSRDPSIEASKEGLKRLSAGP